jgi:hypothetical protein
MNTKSILTRILDLSELTEKEIIAVGQVQGILATVDRELGLQYHQPGFFD